MNNNKLLFVIGILFTTQLAISQQYKPEFAYDLGVSYPISIEGRKTYFDLQLHAGMNILNQRNNGFQTFAYIRGLVIDKKKVVSYGLKGRYLRTIKGDRQIFVGIGMTLGGNANQGVGQFSAETGIYLNKEFGLHIKYDEVTQTELYNNKTVSLGLSLRGKKSAKIAGIVGVSAAAVIGAFIHVVSRSN